MKDVVSLLKLIPFVHVFLMLSSLLQTECNRPLSSTRSCSINFIYIHIFLNQSAKEATWNIQEKKDQGLIHKIRPHIFLNQSSIPPPQKKAFIPVLIHLQVIKESDESVLDTPPLPTKRSHATELFPHFIKP